MRRDGQGAPIIAATSCVMHRVVEYDPCDERRFRANPLIAISDRSTGDIAHRCGRLPRISRHRETDGGAAAATGGRACCVRLRRVTYKQTIWQGQGRIILRRPSDQRAGLASHLEEGGKISPRHQIKASRDKVRQIGVSSRFQHQDEIEAAKACRYAVRVGQKNTVRGDVMRFTSERGVGGRKRIGCCPGLANSTGQYAPCSMSNNAGR